MFSLACASCYLDFFSFLEGFGTIELVLCYMLLSLHDRPEF